jgi:hypothetical protein
VRQARRDASRLERELERLATRETELHALMAEHATDFTRVSDLDAEVRALRDRRAVVEDAWLAAAALLDG